MAAKNVKAEEIFNDALEIKNPEKRAAYLEKACGQDNRLRANVEALLKAHEGAGDFLKAPVLGLDATLENAVLEGPGTQIDRYELLDLVGEGGMGLVYLAEQKEPVRRQVALKILKPGMDTKQVIARFEAERQALALLDHSNIARVLDAGTTETGRPYFVMEYVKGMSITKYCDRHKLSVEKRLKLFLRVCEAVHHAHQKGIIHRDIKPSNILVSVQDDRAIPKIIDFGIAKAIAQPLTQQTLFTRQGQLLGTPEYMSPEQADMDNEDTDTRADIYSLGVVLYELLTGVLPFEHEALEKVGFAELQRILQEEEPPRPSLRFTALGEEAKEIAERRHTQVVALARRLHRELEWIPLKAMRKDRSRRYRSASELADDIQNYLSGAPLIAGPETAVYRVKKFVRKHAGSVATVALVVVAIILGLVVSSAMYFRAEKALQKEAVARTRAEQAEKVAEERAEDYRRSLYYNHIALADASYREGNIGRVSELLDSCPEDLRGWEWHRLSHISDRSSLTIRGHIGQVFGVAFSPDGKRIVSCGVDKTIKVWDAATGAEIKTFRGHESPAGAVSFSPDGRWIVSGSMDNTIKIWDMASGEELMTLRGHKSPVYSVAISPDGKRIVSGGDDKALKVWDSVSGNELMTLRGHTDRVFSVAFSPDGRRIVSGSKDKTIKVWDAATGAELMTLCGHSDMVWSVAFSPDGKRIFSGSRDGTTKLWNLETGNEIKTFHGHVGSTLSPDGRRIVSSGAYGIIYVWDATSGVDLMMLRGHESLIYGLAFGPDGERVVSSSMDGTIKVWNINFGIEHLALHVHKDGVQSVAFSPDGKRLTFVSSDKTIKLWDLSTGTELMMLRWNGDRVKSVAFSPDGKRFVSGGEDGTVKVWDATTGSEVMTLQGEHKEPVSCVAFSLNGKRIVSGDEDKTIKVWDTATGAELMTLRGHNHVVLSVAFSPDGRKIVSGGEYGTVKVWDVKTGAELMTLHGHSGWVVSAAFSPDGKRIVTRGWGGTIRMWDAATGAEVIALPGHYGSPAGVAFSPDGRRMVSGNGVNMAKVWDVATGTELITLHGHSGWVESVAFSPDGKTIAISSESGITLLESEVPAGGYGPRQNGKAAQKVVDELYEETGFYSEVIDKLKADKTLAEPVRKVALQIANSRLWEDAEKLKKQSSESAGPEEVKAQ